MCDQSKERMQEVIERVLVLLAPYLTPDLRCALNELVTQIDSQCATIQAQAQETLHLKLAIQGIIQDSQGVAGYHVNGDVAEWGEFQELMEQLQ